MSDARWCNFGDHPFEGGREGTIVMGRIESVVSGNEYVTANQMKAKEICPECAATLGMFDEYEAPKSPAERRKALLEGMKSK